MKPLKNTIAILIAAVLLLGLLPAAAAADGEAVLTSLGHIDTSTAAVSGTTAVITLTVPSRFAGTAVDLSNNLTIGYNTTRYKLVVAALAAPDAAVIDGAAVTLIVTYNDIADAEGAAKSATSYQVKVVRADAVGPTFSGTVRKEVLQGNSVALSASDFLGSTTSTPPIPSKYSENDGDALGAISITGTNPTFGALWYNGAPYNFGDVVGKDDIHLLTFSPGTAETRTGTVSYDVKAYAGSDWVTPIGNVVLTIVAFDVPSTPKPINETVPKGTILHMTTAYFSSYWNLNGIPLVSVEITPSASSAGKWSYSTSPSTLPVQFTSRKTIPAASLDSLTFTAVTPGTASFSWRVTNTTGTSGYGTGVITVTSPTLTLTSYPSVPVLRGSTCDFEPGYFDYAPVTAVMTYIKLTAVPAATDGYLYLDTALPKDDTYGYPAIAANTALTVNAVIPATYLGALHLATKPTALHDLTSFQWTATADLKATSATWAAPVSYDVSFITGGTLPYYQTDMNIPFALSAADIGGEFGRLTGQSMSYVTFTLPDKTIGALYLNYDLVTKKGTAVTASTKYYAGKTPNLASVTFVPATDYSGTTKISYNAYTSTGGYISSFVPLYVHNYSGGTLSLQMEKNSALQLDAGAFLSSFSAATGKTLSSIDFTNLTLASGHLYYDYVSDGNIGTLVTASNSDYAVLSAPYLSRVSYVPAHDFTGLVQVYFTGYSTEGTSYYCKLVITVVTSPGGIVNYTLNENSYVQLSGNQLADEFVSVTGSLLSYVSFTPPTAASGVLYYQYDTETKKGIAVTAAAKYYNGRTPDISDLTFIPAKDFIGTVSVPYKGYNAAGTAFAGKVNFVVIEGTQVISYATEAGAPVTMNGSDFQRAFYAMSGGQNLSYVKFVLPSVSYGRLYYGYNARTEYDSIVTADKKYALDAAPYLSVVTFVPADTYSGSFLISYTGYSASGASFTGKIRITVAPGASGSVSYATNALTPVAFTAADFSTAYKGTGTLSYVMFTLPHSSYGTLYINYSSGSASYSPVSASTAYYVGGYPGISNITFVPNSGYTGSMAIAYTAYSSTGISSPGSVLITVNSSDIAALKYTTPFNTPVQLTADDFNAAFLSRTGSSLHYIIFSLPSANQGELYLRYASSNSSAAPVTAGTKYYRSYSPLLSDVSFVPKTGFAGPVTIAYTGYTVGGVAYAGKIIITVESGVPFADMKTGYDWAAPAVSYLYSGGIIKGSDDGKFYPSNYMSRGDFILMTARAFGLESYSTDNFSDVPMGIYYYSAIASAKDYGIINGSGGKFYPSAYITRQDAMVIIARTLDVTGLSIAPGYEEDLAAFPDASQISDYAVDAMAALVKAGIITGSGGYLNPKSNITRAEMAVMLYKVLTM